MRHVGVIGSRRFEDRDKFSLLMDECIDELRIPHKTATIHNEIVIVTGDAKGVDRLAVMWARDRDMLYVTYHAEAAWRSMGKAAGAIRTRLVADNCDVLIAMPDEASIGTRIGIQRARGNGMPVAVRRL